MKLKTITSDLLFKIHSILKEKLGEHKDLFLVSLLGYLTLCVIFMQIILIPIDLYMFEKFTGITLIFNCFFLFLFVVTSLIIKYDNFRNYKNNKFYNININNDNKEEKWNI